MHLKSKLGTFEAEKLKYDKMANHIKVSYRHKMLLKLKQTLYLVFHQNCVSPQLQAQDTEKTIKGEFQKLYQFLRAEEAGRIDAVRKEAALKSQTMNLKIVNMTVEIFSLTEKIITLEEDMKAGDMAFMMVCVVINTFDLNFAI